MRRIAAAIRTVCSVGVAALLPGSAARAANPATPAPAAATPTVAATPAGAPAVAPPAVAPPAAEGASRRSPSPAPRAITCARCTSASTSVSLTSFIAGRRRQAARHRSAEPARPARRGPLRRALGRQRLGRGRQPEVRRRRVRQAAVAAVRGGRRPLPAAARRAVRRRRRRPLPLGVRAQPRPVRRGRPCAGSRRRSREALPRLFVQGRIKEALLRAARDARAGSGDAIGTFALAWLERPQADPATDARAAAALLRYGDKQDAGEGLRADQAGARAQGDRGRSRPRRWPRYATAGAAELDTAGFCELLGGARRCARAIRPRASRRMNLLRDSGVQLPQDSPCAKALTENAGDTATPGRLRALSLATLVATTGSAPGKLVRESMEDKDADRPRRRRDGVRQAGRRASGAVPAAAAAAGFVARRPRGRGGRAWCVRAATWRCRSCSRCSRSATTARWWRWRPSWDT